MIALIDLNFDEIYRYAFIISMKSCKGSCNTVEDPFNRICVPNKMRVFYVIKVRNELKALTKHISCECRWEFDGSSRQK